MACRIIGYGRAARFAAMTFGFIGLLLVTGSPSLAQAERDTDAARPQACVGDNGGITLPPGFCATVFADDIGHARQMVVAPNSVLYINTWSGRYYRNDTPPPGGFLVALQDTNGDGRADVNVRFGETRDQGSAGGTGIALYNGALYAEVNDRIVRYALAAGSIVPNGPPEVIVSGLPLTGDHPMHPFKIDARGGLYVDLGSATNSCQVANRMPNSPGIAPCTELATRAGIWRYDANRTGQQFSPAGRFVTGLRNGEGIAFDSAGRMFATQHGRDQLRENWPSLYTPEQGAGEPAEELVQLEQGADYGWPYCYFDLTQHKLVLAPEYGGDGGKTVGLCADKRAPVAAFPAHWAPNDLVIYDAAQFPAGYRGGAFVAFHGSWNRAPSPQGGYNVVFQPLADGKASGHYVVFADGFAGAVEEPGQAAHRPSGLAAAFSTARWRARPAQDATAPTPRGRRWAPISRAPNGCGAMAASHQSRRPSPTAYPSRRSTDPQCPRWAAPSSRNPSSPRSLPMYGRSAIRAGIEGGPLSTPSADPPASTTRPSQSLSSRPDT
jgi:glucose/arabinose dehydrogenase